MAGICWRWNRHLENTGFYRRGMWRNMSKELLAAAKSGDIEKVRELLDRGADVNSKGPLGMTPLHAAAMVGHTEAAALLLDRGCDVNSKGPLGMTPLHAAAMVGHTEAAALLKAHGGVE